MNATIEISLYPLSEDYVKIVTDFILNVKKNKDIEVVTNGMSTQLFGDFTKIMNILTIEIPQVWNELPAIFVVKIGNGLLKSEELPSELK